MTIPDHIQKKAEDKYPFIFQILTPEQYDANILAKKQLDKEKEQITDAYIEGAISEFSAETYYTNTYSE